MICILSMEINSHEVLNEDKLDARCELHSILNLHITGFPVLGLIRAIVPPKTVVTHSESDNNSVLFSMKIWQH